MADFIPILAQQSRLSQIAIADGQLIFVIDTGKTYLDYANQRHLMSTADQGFSDAPSDGYLYARCNGQWQRIQSVTPPQPQSQAVALYGVINDGQTYAVSQITQSMLSSLTQVDLSQPVTAQVPITAGSVTCVLVPAGYAAYKDDGFGGRAPFELNNGTTGTGSNGTTVTLGNTTYKSYGQFNIVTGNTIIYIQQES